MEGEGPAIEEDEVASEGCGWWFAGLDERLDEPPQ